MYKKIAGNSRYIFDGALKTSLVYLLITAIHTTSHPRYGAPFFLRRRVGFAAAAESDALPYMPHMPHMPKLPHIPYMPHMPKLPLCGRFRILFALKGV
jgi:hypothetical protein